MRVLISGSTGSLGSALIPRLEEAGHEPVRLLRGERRPGDLSWDPYAAEIDDLSGIDAVVNLSGAGIGDKRWTDERKKTLYDSRIVTTSVLAEAIAAANPRPEVFLSQSAIGIYGADAGDTELTEDSPAGTDFLAQLCVAWEAAAAPAAEAGTRVAIMRTAVVLDSLLERLALPFKLGLGGRLGSGEQWMTWIALDDQLGAMLHLLEADLAGPVNLVSGNPVTNAEFTDTLGDVLNRPTVLPTPLFPLKALYGAEMVETTLLGSTRVVGDRLQQSGYDVRYPDLAEALRSDLA